VVNIVRETTPCSSQICLISTTRFVDTELLVQAGKSAAMDVDVIRSRFIQENLRSALLERDRARAARVLRAFRNYFQWFEHRVPDLEKLTILSQLASLEKAYSGDGLDKALPSVDQVSAR
jgi:hypothetical protein